MTQLPLVSGLHQIALVTSNLERSTAFYRDTLGLPLIASFDPPGLAFFDLDGVRLSIQQNADRTAASSVIYLSVADIEGVTKSLQDHGVIFDREPELVFKDESGQFGEAGDEEWMAFFKDPDGNMLALASRQRT